DLYSLYGRDRGDRPERRLPVAPDRLQPIDLRGHDLSCLACTTMRPRLPNCRRARTPRPWTSSSSPGTADTRPRIRCSRDRRPHIVELVAEAAFVGRLPAQQTVRADPGLGTAGREGVAPAGHRERIDGGGCATHRLHAQRPAITIVGVLHRLLRHG